MHELGIIIHISKKFKEVAEENEDRFCYFGNWRSQWNCPGIPFRLLGLLPEEIGPVIGIGIAYRDASGGNHV